MPGSTLSSAFCYDPRNVIGEEAGGLGVKWRVWLKRTALVLAAAIVVLIFGWVPYWFGGMATTRRFQFPDKENAGLTPASFNRARTVSQGTAAPRQSTLAS